MPIVETVSGRNELKKFIEYPYQKFKNHPTWVPPLLLQEWEDYNPKKNPFYEHAEVELFLALEGARVVGRIAAIHDRSYNTHRDESNTGRSLEDSGPCVVRARLPATTWQVCWWTTSMIRPW
jgi:hypothetical protein